MDEQYTTPDTNDQTQQRIEREEARLRKRLPALGLLPTDPEPEYRRIAERNVAAGVQREREAARDRRERELRMTVKGLISVVERLETREARRRPEHGRAGQLREAMRELVNSGLKVSKANAAKWMRIGKERLSKSPLREVYADELQNIRRKAAANRVRAKSYYDA